MKKIEEIKNPDFLKELNNTQLEALAQDMRQFILEKVSQNGGHLSSNLGIVDLTIAMLKVFDAQKDIIIFDVGHQSYPYKILTGRAKEFDTLRKSHGLSGFQSIKESTYDHYEAGHSSTSISAGLGFALARDYNKENYEVISVIGDGSISNGLAYEALNHIGDLKTKQIIILNDNQMSISQNVGAMHNFLDSIRAGRNYQEVKKNTKKVLSVTKIGKVFANSLDHLKNGLKKLYLRKASIFDDLGIEYYGPINGHDYEELIKYLNIAKNETKPVILHVITQKGKGYSYAEQDHEGKYHGIGRFDLTTGQPINTSHLPSFSEIVSTYVYNFARKDDKIICITPGMCYGSKLQTIAEKLPKQYIDVGIAEEHALVLANALAIQKMKPIVFIYSSFLQRGYDQIVHDIARMNSHVILCIDRAGIIPGDGVSHQGIYDISMLMSIPNMVICCPTNAQDANDLIFTALNYNGPIAIRYPKTNLKYDYSKAKELPIGSWETLTKGQMGTIISYGDFINNALLIAKELAKEGISLNVINAKFIKPFDHVMFSQIVQEGKKIFIYEESTTIGSLGSILATEITKYQTSSKLSIYGIKDEFLNHATRQELIEQQHLDVKSITEAIKKEYKL